MVDTFLADHVMSGVTQWIKDCTSGGHEDCVSPGNPRLPSRVLDVGDAGSATVRLYTSRVDERGEYVTLSYCWGGPQPLTTNRANYEELSNGIIVVQLPKTLQDAVIATRRLGFRFLWIDALCIVQDDEEDKAREMGNMGTIYRNATVTIAAARSRSASSGFLEPDLARVQTDSCKMPILLPGAGGEHGEVTLAVEVTSFGPSHPLLTRGWAFQEAVLSPRLVVFSEFEVYCQCSRPEFARMFNSGSVRRLNTDRLYSPDSRTFNDMQKNRREEGDGWMKAKYLAQAWEEMVGQFTLRALTDPGDRLPGVQGLASELATHLGLEVNSEYKVGVWMGCLPQLLLWSRNNTPTLDWHDRAEAAGTGIGSLPVYRPGRSPKTPTWSWASIDCPVMFTSDDWDRYTATVSVVPCDVSGLAASQDTRKVDRGEDGAIVLEVECEMLFQSSEQVAEAQSSAKVRVIMDLETDEQATNSDGVYYMLLCKNVGPEMWTPDVTPAGALLLWYVSGLVVQKVGQGVFKRLGYFRWDIGESVEDEISFGRRSLARLV
ncbi:hypothetical protein EsH8_V_000637 [Colletotrichum jinshuiense]